MSPTPPPWAGSLADCSSLLSRTTTSLASHDTGYYLTVLDKPKMGLMALTPRRLQGSLTFWKLGERNVGVALFCFAFLVFRIVSELSFPASRGSLRCLAPSSIFGASRGPVLITWHHCDTGCHMSLFPI